METTSLGVSGVSLALGVYNTNLIKTLEEKFDVFTEKSNDIVDDTLDEEEETVESAAAVAPIDTAFVPSDSEEILKIQENLSSIENDLNIVSTRSSTNYSAITLMTDDLDLLRSFVTDNIVGNDDVVGLRSRVTANENDIIQINADMGILQSEMKDVDAKADNSNEGITSLGIVVESIKAEVTNVSSRIDDADAMTTDLSDKITNNLEMLGSLEDYIGVIDSNLTDTKDSLENLQGRWNTFNATAYVADDLLTVTNMSVSTLDVTTSFEANKCKLYENSDGATFSHVDATDVPCISQTSSGNTVIRGANTLDMKCGNTWRFLAASNLTTVQSPAHISFETVNEQRLYLHNSGAIVFRQSFDGASSTQFSTARGENYIHAGEGKATTFGFGGASRIVMTAGEIQVNGTKIMETITDLETRLEEVQLDLVSAAARIKTLEAECIRYNGNVRLQNTQSLDFIRARSGKDYAYVDTTTKDSWSQFQMIA